MNNGLLGFSEVANAGRTAATITSSTNVVLTAASAQTQNITMSSSTLSVTLPNATQLTYNNPSFLVRNTGTNAFDITDSTGAVIYAALAANQSVLVWLRDNTTAAGLWSSISNSAVAPAVTYVSSAATTPLSNTVWAGSSMCLLNSTQVLYVLSDTTATGSLYAAVVTVNGSSNTTVTSVTWVKAGLDPILVAGTNSISCCAINTNQAIVVTTDGMAYSLSFNGTSTLSVVCGGIPFGNGSYAVSVAPTGNNSVVVTASDNVYSGTFVWATVIGYDASANLTVAGQAFSTPYTASSSVTPAVVNIGTDTFLVTYPVANKITAYVMTAGVMGPVQTFASLPVNQNICKATYLGSGQVLIVYRAQTTFYPTAAILTVAGTSITAGSPTTIVSTNTFLNGLCTLSSSGALFYGSDGYLYAMSVSGTTITVGTAVLATGPGSATVTALAQSNTNKAVFTYHNGTSGIASVVVSVSGTTITYNTASTVATAFGATAVQPYSCQTNTDQVCFVAVDASLNLRSYSVNTASTTAVQTVGSTFVFTPSAPAVVGIVPTAATGAFAVIFLDSVNYTNYEAFGYTVAAGSSGPAIGSVTAVWPSAITLGTAVGGAPLALAYSSTNKAMCFVSYLNSASSYFGFTASISGTTVTTPTISYSAPNTFASTYNLVSAQNTTNSVTVMYQGGGNVTRCHVVTVSGYVPTWQTVSSLGLGAVPQLALATITTNKLLISWYGSSSLIYSSVVTVSGNALTIGGSFNLFSGTTIAATGGTADFSISNTVASQTSAIIATRASTTSVAFVQATISGTALSRTTGTTVVTLTTDEGKKQTMQWASNSALWVYKSNTSGAVAAYNVLPVKV